LPQLAVATYPSQIFWILIGFLFFYLFVSKVAIPGLQEIMKSRATHVESILKAASLLKDEAEKLESSSRIALENAQIEASAKENKLMADFREKTISQRNAFYERMTRESAEKSVALAKAANEAFSAISQSSDEIVNRAIKVLSKEVSNEH